MHGSLGPCAAASVSCKDVIVLDTNQLEYAQSPDGSLLAMLKTVALC